MSDTITTRGHVLRLTDTTHNGRRQSGGSLRSSAPCPVTRTCPACRCATPTTWTFTPAARSPGCKTHTHTGGAHRTRG